MRPTTFDDIQVIRTPKTRDKILLVSDADVARALACAHHVRRQVIKRGVAVGLAVLLTGKVTFAGRVVGALISRGNIAPEQPAQILVGQQRGKEL